MSRAKELAKKVETDAKELAEILESPAEEKERTAQTVATEKWNEKTGFMSKSYKLKRETVDAFMKACEERRETQSAVLMELMNGFVNGVEEKMCVFCRISNWFRKRRGR